MHDEDGVEQLYLVCEARGTFNLDDLDWDKAAHPSRGCRRGLNPPVSSRLLAM